jgi:hypothetical protein
VLSWGELPGKARFQIELAVALDLDEDARRSWQERSFRQKSLEETRGGAKSRRWQRAVKNTDRRRCIVKKAAALDPEVWSGRTWRPTMMWWRRWRRDENEEEELSGDQRSFMMKSKNDQPEDLRVTV